MVHLVQGYGGALEAGDCSSLWSPSLGTRLFETPDPTPPSILAAVAGLQRESWSKPQTSPSPPMLSALRNKGLPPRQRAERNSLSVLTRGLGRVR